MIAMLQPRVPHYRTSFFQGIDAFKKIDIYCYDQDGSVNFLKSEIKVNELGKIQLGPFLLYNPLSFLNKNYKTLVLMLHFGHLITWILLLTKFIHKKEIILWGQGISIKRYLKEEKQPNILLRWMILLADKVWVYTSVQRDQWKLVFPDKQIVSLNNTISDVDELVMQENDILKFKLKEGLNISQEIIFIYCARFESTYRRTDLLEGIIQNLDSKKYGFIIIGEGPFKPDFSNYKNVYDFGAVYDRNYKNNLFMASDLYFQPGWIGLSIVEAFAYGIPVLTFKRGQNILQGVEYDFIEDGYNGLIFKNIDSCLLKIMGLSKNDIEILSENAKTYAKKKLTMDQMIQNALETL